MDWQLFLMRNFVSNRVFDFRNSQIIVEIEFPSIWAKTLPITLETNNNFIFSQFI